MSDLKPGDREHAAAIAAWRDRRPAGTRAALEMSITWPKSEEIGAFVTLCRTPTEMREAARELQALADWFAKKPTRRAT